MKENIRCIYIAISNARELVTLKKCNSHESRLEGKEEVIEYINE